MFQKKEKATGLLMQIIGGTITLIVGLILLFHPFGSVKFLTALLGIVLIYYGILFLGR